MQHLPCTSTANPASAVHASIAVCRLPFAESGKPDLGREALPKLPTPKREETESRSRRHLPSSAGSVRVLRSVFGVRCSVFSVRCSPFVIRHVARSRGALAPSPHGARAPLLCGCRAPPKPSPAPSLSRLAAPRTSARRATGAFAKPASPWVPDGNRASPEAIGDQSRFACPPAPRAIIFSKPPPTGRDERTGIHQRTAHEPPKRATARKPPPVRQNVPPPPRLMVKTTPFRRKKPHYAKTERRTVKPERQSVKPLRRTVNWFRRSVNWFRHP